MIELDALESLANATNEISRSVAMHHSVLLELIQRVRSAELRLDIRQKAINECNEQISSLKQKLGTAVTALKFISDICEWNEGHIDTIANETLKKIAGET